MSAIGKRVFLVDDDAQLVELLSMRLQHAGYSVEGATHAEQGYQMAQHEEFDVIVLDIVMPKLNGIDICTGLRAQGILTPILVLSGQTEKGIVIEGLNAGADDYLTKPFDNDELLARIRALLRRNRKAYKTRLLKRGGLVLDIEEHVVRKGEAVVPLTGKESLLLQRLMADAPKPIARLSLLRDVWNIGGHHASNRLDVYIRRVRQKLRPLSGDEYIHTVRGGGYYFASNDQ